MEGQFQTEEVFKKVLIKKINNFRTKLPIIDLQTRVAGGFIYFESKMNKLNSKLEIEYSLSEKANIKRLKDILTDYFPNIYSIEEKEKSVSEIINSDLDNLQLKNVIKKDKFRVERRLDEYNEILVRNLETNTLELFKLNKPITLFLKLLHENKEEASILFQEQSEFVKQVEERFN
jgi:hypothetical protein